MYKYLTEEKKSRKEKKTNIHHHESVVVKQHGSEAKSKMINIMND